MPALYDNEFGGGLSHNIIALVNSRLTQELTFVENSQCSKHWAKNFTCNYLFNHHNDSVRENILIFFFFLTHDETEAQRG